MNADVLVDKLLVSFFCRCYTANCLLIATWCCYIYLIMKTLSTYLEQ